MLARVFGCPLVFLVFLVLVWVDYFCRSLVGGIISLWFAKFLFGSFGLHDEIVDGGPGRDSFHTFSFYALSMDYVNLFGVMGIFLSLFWRNRYAVVGVFLIVSISISACFAAFNQNQ